MTVVDSGRTAVVAGAASPLLSRGQCGGCFRGRTRLSTDSGTRPHLPSLLKKDGQWRQPLSGEQSQSPRRVDDVQEASVDGDLWEPNPRHRVSGAGPLSPGGRDSRLWRSDPPVTVSLGWKLRYLLLRGTLPRERLVPRLRGDCCWGPNPHYLVVAGDRTPDTAGGCRQQGRYNKVTP